MKRVFSISLLLLVATFLWAVPAIPTPLYFTQPDGSNIEVFMHGDEFGYFYTDAVGNRLIRLPDNSFLRDTLPEMQWQAMKKQSQIHRAAAQAALDATFPRQGKVRSLVILVEYADVKFTIPNPQDAFRRLLNEPGYTKNAAIGSARDYFLAASSGTFLPDFDVYGPFTLPKNRSYYGANINGNYMSHADDMIIGACDLAAEAGVDFSLYDENNDGVIDNVFVYYAGHNEAEGGPEESVWPHRSAINSSRTFSGKRLHDYACTSELKSQQGATMCGIGTFCHEFSHVLGLPDLYNTNDNSSQDRHYTVGTWDLMASGSYNCDGKIPPTYSAWERFFLGWLTPVQLSDAGNQILPPLETSNTAFLIASTPHNLNGSAPSPNEYFLLENRQPIGWDSVYNSKSSTWSTLPGRGLVVWHITHDAKRLENNTINNFSPLGVDIVEAYNTNPIAASQSDPFPGSMEITRFLPMLNNGETLPLQKLTRIREWNDNSISFFFGVSNGTGFSFVPEELPVLTSSFNEQIADFEAQPLMLVGRKLRSDSVFVSLSNSEMQLSLDSGKTWQNYVQPQLFLAKDSTFDMQVLVRHNPSKIHCHSLQSVLRIYSPNGEQEDFITISGVAPRPQLITTPQLLPAKDVNYTSALLSWKQQFDAEQLYLLLYALRDGTSSVLQGFEDFHNPLEVVAQGWSTNTFNVSTTAINEGKQSLFLSQTGDSIISEYYPLPVQELSFWLSNTYNQSGASGLVFVDGLANGIWQRIDSIKVLKTTTSRTVVLPLDTLANYRQFRLTYRHPTNVGGGACLDAFTASFAAELTYVYRGHEYPIPPSDTTYLLTGLNSNTQYFYALQAYEHKSCNEHQTDWSSVRSFTTLREDLETAPLELRLQYEGFSHVVMVPTRATEATLYVFNSLGKLVFSAPIPPATEYIPLPTQYFTPGEIYLIKYAPQKAYKRKHSSAKIIF